MSWNPGYTLEQWNEYPTKEEATSTLSNVATTAPSRSQMLTASAVQFPNDQTQQGAAAIQPNSTSYLMAGSTLAFPVWARWW